jgi:hypothetical protein
LEIYLSQAFEILEFRGVNDSEEVGNYVQRNETESDESNETATNESNETTTDESNEQQQMNLMKQQLVKLTSNNNMNIARQKSAKKRGQ